MELTSQQVERVIEKVFQSLIPSQEKRCLDIAHRINEKILLEDLLQPHDLTELQSHPLWNYEDGFLAGIRCVQIILRKELKELNLAQAKEEPVSQNP